MAAARGERGLSYSNLEVVQALPEARFNDGIEVYHDPFKKPSDIPVENVPNSPIFARPSSRDALEAINY